MKPINKQQTIREAHQWASSFLKENQIPTPELEAEVFIRHLYGFDRTKFFLYLNQAMAEEQGLQLKEMVQRRVKHEPLQYIIGTQEFYGRSFTVNPDVLIPRPETELLVEEVIKTASVLFGKEALTVIDIGTGSGAIAITLTLEKPEWDLHTVDISTKAIQTAKSNSLQLGAEVQFHLGNGLDPAVKENMKIDIIVSNPPYIPSRDIETLMEEVKDHEPMLALDGGEDGLDFYRDIIQKSEQVLKRPGLIAFEIGIGQELAISELLKLKGADQVKIVNDFQDIPRIVLGLFLE